MLVRQEETEEDKEEPNEHEIKKRKTTYEIRGYINVMLEARLDYL